MDKKERIPASSDILTHDVSVPADQEISFLRTHGDCDLHYISSKATSTQRLIQLCEETAWERSRYSDWLRAARPRGRSSSPGRVQNFLFSTASRPALGSIQPPIQWVPGALSPEVKWLGREADHSLPNSAAVPLRFHGVVLN
jgi:hypothetical protein